MSIHAALHHVTRYRYDRFVSLSPQVVRLRPAPHGRTRIVSYSLRVEPAQHFINWQQDPFSNYLARLVFPERTREFTVTVDVVAEMAVHNPFDFFLEPLAERFPFAYPAPLQRELAPYLRCDPLTPRWRALVESIDRHERSTIDFLVALNQRLQHDIRYLIRMEPGVQTPEQTLEQASGSCRDSAWLLVQTLRHLGLAARFVSGYLIQLTPDVKAVDGPSGPAQDFTDLHAWCEVYLPGAGWIGFDPTSGLLAGEGHIPLACTPEPTSAAPITGAVDPCEVEFGHEMGVQRIWESPRVTKPYTPAQWDQILALGDRVDTALVQGDVRLTMGGEPTYVATDDRDSAEWNTDALGPTKRMRAQDLLHRLAARYAQGGFLHFGQGKWYPGEQLPRWALSAYWRTDGQACWRDPARLADERDAHHYTHEDAQRFVHALARRLGFDGRTVAPGYEDAFYYLWRERRLPVNVDPYDARLDDELERARLRRVFEHGLLKPVGYALPLQPTPPGPALAGPTWTTGPWFFRDERMLLIPGDSPMGYRLPLDSLPWVREADYPFVVPADPFAPVAPLAPAGADTRGQAGGPAAFGHAAPLGGNARAVRDGRAQEAGAHGALERPASAGVGARIVTQQPGQRAPERFESANWVTRTALVVEARDPQRANGARAELTRQDTKGVLYVFMPPLARLDDYLDLLAAVEDTAAELGVAIVLEGYPPPRDERLKLLQVTPDPGVIEVNIHPVSQWRELVANTEFLYESAHQCKLGAEKFMLDGRHTGTGGGNHFVVGGARPADSPFLRRPDLLASLIAYWHNHPSLSYLFSGLFIGPTSQAPRVDEARNDQVFELEIALREIARAGVAPAPWFIDRALRNVLVDVTGNTHRSEFCIDKLYSPDSSTGRLGLLELRAFEMPPHARMSCVQQLLLRALIARFWQQPYRADLVRWGTRLHDRFMLPTFIELDFADVLAEMREAGWSFDDAWFAPHLEFRFPRVGEIAARGIHLQMRHALEPWHVMGEEGAVGGTVRYVDSSLERIEVKASGLVDERHRIAVNGVPLAMQPTGRAGEYVAGVRFRAWRPPSALHPSIGVHAPLTIDIVDTWSGRALAGCQYHVAHPGGRNYETFPVNAYEAESRRLARFFARGHTPGTMSVPAATRSLEHPFTLDLRAP